MSIPQEKFDAVEADFLDFIHSAGALNDIEINYIKQSHDSATGKPTGFPLNVQLTAYTGDPLLFGKSRDVTIRGCLSFNLYRDNNGKYRLSSVSLTTPFDSFQRAQYVDEELLNQDTTQIIGALCDYHLAKQKYDTLFVPRELLELKLP